MFEGDGEWSRALRRFIAPEIRVRELPTAILPSLPESSWPWVSLVVVTRPDEAEWAMAWAQRLQRARPHYLRMAVMRPAEQEFAWCLRETGMVMVWDEFWQVPAMARMVERFWQRMPPPDLSVERRIWNNLPWNSAGVILNHVGARAAVPRRTGPIGRGEVPITGKPSLTNGRG